MRGLPAAVVLVAVYALALGSAHPLDLLAGVVIAAAVLVAVRRFGPDEPRSSARTGAGRILRFPRFAAATAREVVTGTWRVALVALGFRSPAHAGIVAVPIGERSPSGVAASALALTLSPGELLVDVDWERRVMLVHVMDASDPDEIRDHYRRFYERYQRGVFP